MSSHNTAIWLRISSENISCLCDEQKGIHIQLCQRKKPISLKKLKPIIGILLMLFIFLHLQVFWGVFFQYLNFSVCIKACQQTVSTTQSSSICNGNYSRLTQDIVCVYIFRKIPCKLFMQSQISSTSFPAHVPDKYSIIYLSLKLNMYSGKHLHILVIYFQIHVG